jgi:TfoX/Sxy family transcriptional regulator of competence genes
VASRKKSPVSKWKPASDEWVRSFDASLPSNVEKRKMFGYPAAFVNGNMAAGLHQDGLVLRLPEDDRNALVAEGGVPFEPMPGRVMREYVVAPQKLASKAAELKRWLDRAIKHAAAMPAKKKKAKGR